MQGTRKLNKLWTIDTPPPIVDSIKPVVDALTMADIIISTMHPSYRQKC